MSDSQPEYVDQGLNGTVEENVPVETPGESINPIWASALENIPEEFHSQLTPTFKTWDENFAKERETVNKYKPYDSIISQGIPVEHIQQSMQLAEIFKSSPRDLYDYLNTQYNYSATTSPVEEEEPENFDLATEGKYDLTKDPQYIQLQQQVAFNEQRYQQEQQSRVNAEMNMQVDSEVKQVTEAFPMLDIADVANMALGLSQNSGKMPNLMEAAQQMAKYIPKERASDGAPPSISGNRGLPSAGKPNFGAMTADERSRFVADAMRAQDQ